MSINQISAINPNKSRRYGKFYGSIDFTINESLSANAIKTDLKNQPAGEFEIGGRKYELTWAEMNRIIETMQDGQDAIMKTYRYGLYNN
tara:strand:- start:184 stop:450 length:267 start_codon:yes stop_codon:yes gene_type:complete